MSPYRGFFRVHGLSSCVAIRISICLIKGAEFGNGSAFLVKISIVVIESSFEYGS